MCACTCVLVFACVRMCMHVLIAFAWFTYNLLICNAFSFSSSSHAQVDFKPPKCVTATSGFMSKTVKEDHKYVTVLKNTKPLDVSVHMFMQCPKSETDKIKYVRVCFCAVYCVCACACARACIRA